MGRALICSPYDFINKETETLVDDFGVYVDTQIWTKLASEGTVALEGDGGKSRLKLNATNTDNNEVCVASTVEMWTYTANKAIHAAGLVQYAEAATDDANVAFGFADAFGSDLIGDDGASAASGAATINDSGALIFKVDGGTVWKFQTEIGGSATTSTSTKTAGGTTAQLLEIDILPLTSTIFQARPFVDGAPLIDSTTKDPICHTVTLGTATAMDFGVYVKTGSANAQAVYLDWVVLQQTR